MSDSSQSTDVGAPKRKTARKSTAAPAVARHFGDNKIGLNQILRIRKHQAFEEDESTHTQSSGYSSSKSSKPDPLQSLTTRLGRKIDRRYERRLSAKPERPVVREGLGRGKDVRLLREAHRRRVRSGYINMSRLRTEAHINSVKPCIPLAPFARLVRELAINEENIRDLGPIKFQHAALLALREAVEGFSIAMFEQCSLFITHAGRKTLMNKDIFLAKRLWDRSKKLSN